MFCGHCGKRVPVSEPIYDAEEIIFRFRHTINSEHFDNYARYSNFFCEDCFRGFLSTNLEKIDVDYKTAQRKMCQFFREYGFMKNKGLLHLAISISYFVTAPFIIISLIQVMVPNILWPLIRCSAYKGS